MKTEIDYKKTPMVLVEGGRRIFTVCEHGCPMLGWKFQANNIQEVGEWIAENRPYYKESGLSLKTPCWESSPVRTAQLDFYKFWNDAMGSQHYEEIKLGFFAEDLYPTKFKTWEEQSLEERIENLKNKLLDRGVLYRNETLDIEAK